MSQKKNSCLVKNKKQKTKKQNKTTITPTVQEKKGNVQGKKKKRGNVPTHCPRNQKMKKKERKRQHAEHKKK